jgi:HK97 family phage portal protein
MFLAGPIAQRSATDDFWYQPAARSMGGAMVTSDSALRLSTVYKCVRAISETMGMLPMPVYRRLTRGKERDAGHPLAELLQNQPNPWQTAMQWREMMQGHASLLGNGYSEIVYAGSGRVDMLVPLPPLRTRIEVLPNGMPRYKTVDSDGRERTLVFGQVMHLAGFSTDGYTGLNPIEAEREAIGAAITSRDFGSAYFGNAARPPMWIEHPGKFSDDDARRRFVNGFREAYSGARQGTVPVLDQGLKLHALSLSPADSQYIETRKYQDVDICGLWRVPPHKVGIYDQAKWANVEQAALEWVSDCILPWCRRWEQMLLRDLDFGESHFPEILIDALLRGDTKTRYEAYGKAIQDGWLLRNEARERENLNALDGLDTPLEPMNMAPAGSRGADQARGSPLDSRGNAVLQASAERVARKEVALVKRCAPAADKPVALAGAFEGHARFVAEVMAVSLPTAEAHVAQTIERACCWLDPSTPSMLAEDALTTQTAALMRLED